MFGSARCWANLSDCAGTLCSQPASLPLELFASQELRACVCEILCCLLVQLDSTGSPASLETCFVWLQSQASTCLGHSVWGNSGPPHSNPGEASMAPLSFKGYRLTGIHLEESRWPWTQQCLVRNRCEDLWSTWHRRAPWALRAVITWPVSHQVVMRRRGFVLCDLKRGLEGQRDILGLWFGGRRAIQLLDLQRKTGLLRASTRQPITRMQEEFWTFARHLT